MNGQPIWLPYCGPGSTPVDWLARWNLDPVLLIVMVLSFIAAAWLSRGSPRHRRAALALAGVALIISFVSPLCALSSALFSARTVHHVLLVSIAAPLLALALPRRVVARVPSLGLATAAQALILWAWHAPSAYAAALSSDIVYWIMQATLLASALWFWAAVRRATAGAAVAGLLITTVQTGLLGALILFSAQPLYAPHFATTLSWGLTPLVDQQAAGLIMWVPAAGLYLASALILLGRMIGGEERPRVRNQARPA